MILPRIPEFKSHKFKYTSSYYIKKTHEKMVQFVVEEMVRFLVGYIWFSYFYI